MELLIGNFNCKNSYYLIHVLEHGYSLQKNNDLKYCSYLAPIDSTHILGVSETQKWNGINTGSIFLSTIENDHICVEDSVSSNGLNPCHILHDSGSIYISNYDSGNLAIFNILNHQLKLTENLVFSKKSKVHCSFVEGDHLFIVDAGEDKIHITRNVGTKHILFDSVSFPTNTRPRHIIKGINDTFYLITENNNIYTMLFNNGSFSVIDILYIGTKTENETASAIKLSEDKSQLFTTLRGTNLIKSFDVKKQIPSPLQTVYSEGISPRDLDITKKSCVVCNTDSDSLSIFQMQNGFLFHEKNIENIPSPSYVKVLKI